jgi:hypothetical protein
MQYIAPPPPGEKCGLVVEEGQGNVQDDDGNNGHDGNNGDGKCNEHVAFI